MRNRIRHIGLSALLAAIMILCGCTKDSYLPGPYNFLIKIRNGGYIVEEISYNRNNLVSEVNSTSFYRKFHYDQDLRLIREEVAISPDSYSSLAISGTTHEFVDPEKTGIFMYHLYEYDHDSKHIMITCL